MVIGLTGGIGSGKSVIAEQLRKMGYAVYDTDKEAKRIIHEHRLVRQRIERLFGNKVYKDGIYQTALVAEKVFNQPSLLEELNKIVHPAVSADIQRWLCTKLNCICFIECAILYSSGIAELCDKVIAINAPEDIRLQRTILRDHTDINKVRARMRAQDVNSDIQRADFIINNDGTYSIPSLCEQILEQVK